MDKDMRVEYKMLLETYKKLGGEEYYDELVKRRKRNAELDEIRNKIKQIELVIPASDIIECAYKFNEK